MPSWHVMQRQLLVHCWFGQARMAEPVDADADNSVIRRPRPRLAPTYDDSGNKSTPRISLRQAVLVLIAGWNIAAASTGAYGNAALGSGKGAAAAAAAKAWVTGIPVLPTSHNVRHVCVVYRQGNVSAIVRPPSCGSEESLCALLVCCLF